MRPALDRLYRIQRWFWRRFRPRSRGVKVMLFNAAGELLLIRNSYGRSDLFVLPGGGVRRGEQPAQAAAREIAEELGLRVERLAFVSEHLSEREGKRDTVHLFSARAAGEPKADGFEVEEARYFALDALPPSTSPATRRRIAEYRGERAADGSW